MKADLELGVHAVGGCDGDVARYIQRVLVAVVDAALGASTVAQFPYRDGQPGLHVLSSMMPGVVEILQRARRRHRIGQVVLGEAFELGLAITSLPSVTAAPEYRYRAAAATTRRNSRRSRVPSAPRRPAAVTLSQRTRREWLRALANSPLARAGAGPLGPRLLRAGRAVVRWVLPPSPFDQTRFDGCRRRPSDLQAHSEAAEHIGFQLRPKQGGPIDRDPVPVAPRNAHLDVRNRHYSGCADLANWKAHHARSGLPREPLLAGPMMV